MHWLSEFIAGVRDTAIGIGRPSMRCGAGRSQVAALVDRHRVWFRSSDVRLAPAAEAMASALLAPAMCARRLLHVESPVCATWARHLPALAGIFRSRWYPDAPGAFALAEHRPAAAAAGTAVCFSAGVDSFHALLTGGHAIDTLVYAIGYDVKLRERTRAGLVEQSIRTVAAETGTRAVVIHTNLRRHPLVRATPWLHAFSGAIAALGHLLRDDVGHLLTSSDGLGAVSPDVSSGPDTDPLYGSAAVRISHVAPLVTRWEKLERLAAEPLARRHLRVCWKNVGRQLNCGACEKCLRTMVALDGLGALGRFEVFPRHEGLAAGLDALAPPEPTVAGFYHDALARGLPPATAAAVRRLIDRMAPERPRAVAVRAPSRRLLGAGAFAHVFEPLVGRFVGYVRPLGNVGDDLIELAMTQLLAEFGIRWAVWRPGATDGFDALVFGGGGNMGTRYRNNHDLRSAALASGIPLTILPQSFTSAEDRPFARVHVRERDSLRYCPDGVLAPDLALGLEWPLAAGPSRDLGVFLRRDRERRGRKPWFARDPVRLCRTPADYLALAANYRRIVTDRLHFAIAGLHAGRHVTLVANDYHKNRSMHATWLDRLGCRFADSAAAALAGRDAAVHHAA